MALVINPTKENFYCLCESIEHLMKHKINVEKIIIGSDVQEAILDEQLTMITYLMSKINDVYSNSLYGNAKVEFKNKKLFCLWKLHNK